MTVTPQEVVIEYRHGNIWYSRREGEVSEWERETLFANGFHRDNDGRRFLAKSTEATRYAALQIKKGGVS